MASFFQPPVHVELCQERERERGERERERERERENHAAVGACKCGFVRAKEGEIVFVLACVCVLFWYASLKRCKGGCATK